VSADGSFRTDRSWPRPIHHELPFGDEGAIAWGDGLAKPNEVHPGYVMYREGADADVRIEELPVRPTTGVWWNGRLYWSCYPRRVETWTGISSWAPGEDVRLELPGFEPILGMRAVGNALMLEPGGRPEAGKWRRVLARRGWRWQPGSDPVSMEIGPLGVASSRDTHRTWTATAHPEADCVMLESIGGRQLSMRCYYPFQLAWLGDSLLVSTIEADLLWFEDLAQVLDRQQN
jgi:hypothetical protein